MEKASHFARMSLAGLDREYPNKPNELLNGPADLKTPRELHPAFWGHFDWHSSVHAHWMLVRLLRLHPDLPEATEIRTRIAAHLTAANLLAEAAYFEPRHNQSFERMYGWAWLLRLAQELRGSEDPDARVWAANLRPLEERIVSLAQGYLPRLTYPVRSGIHPDTAWALSQMIDYARATGNVEFEALLVQRARDYYEKDAGYPTNFEPSGQDFFSPGLNVADLMRRVLKPKPFSSWLNRFAPGLRRARLGAWATPAVVSDLEDPQIVHLVGLNVSRASAMQGIASALDPRDRRRGNLERAMQAHAAAGLPLVSSGHYEGEHWLASFAVYYLTGAGLADSTGNRGMSGATEINHDFSRRVVLHTVDLPWSPSPMAGVERRMLDRIGGEVARATSIVRYAPASRFSRHAHGGGEEYLVLEGVFSDEHGHNPPGSYVRNPPGSGHSPYSEGGCTIFVKLWQFAEGDTQAVRVDAGAAQWQEGFVPGHRILPLHEHGGVRTRLSRSAPGTVFMEHVHERGEEILVLEGSLHDEDGDYPALTWLRLPAGSRHTPRAGEDGVLLYVKEGHMGAEWLGLP